ncbi:MAG: universal stress protein [Kiloniellales bacterium]|nr:universal stress protein [Kiloniellales bacterium]
MVKDASQGQKGSPVGRGPILVAVDFSKDSEAALVWACKYAGQVGAAVLVLHVVHDPIETPGSYRRSEADALRPMEDVAAEMLKQFIEKTGETHPELRLDAVSTQLVRGIPETRILEVAEQEGAGMIVMGSKGRTGLPHLLLGSKAERVVQRAALPVTIVKAEAEDG